MIRSDRPWRTCRSMTALLTVLLTLSVAWAVAPPVAAAGTRPARAEAAWIARTLERMTLDEKVGQLLVGQVYGARPDTPDRRNVRLYGVETSAQAVAKFHLGGVIYFGWAGNVDDPAQIARLSDGLQHAAATPGAGGGTGVPLIVSADQETGALVARVGEPAAQLPGAMALGAARDPALTREAFHITAEELRALGINTDNAPDADVNVNPANPVIGVRSFSSRPDLVSTLVTAAIDGLHAGDTAAVAKHFPGHGDTATDSHSGLPVITHTRAEWERIDAPPFRAAIAAGVDAIMTAHISFPALDPSGDPATLSRPILTGLLRDELGFDGVVITDALTMEGVRQRYGDAEVAVRALEAGADILLMSPAPEAAVGAVLGAVHDGRLTEKRIDTSVRRILALKWDRGMVAHPQVDVSAVDAVVGTPAHLARAQAITDRTTTLLVDDGRLLPLPASSSVLVTGWGQTRVPMMADALRAGGRGADALWVGNSPTPDGIAQVVAAARGHDVALVLTREASLASGASQRDLVAALVAAGAAVAVVAVGTPYDVTHLPGVEAFIATYSYTRDAIGAAARVLTGDLRPTGRLPVDVPQPGAPGRIAYPFGFGLTPLIATAEARHPRRPARQSNVVVPRLCSRSARIATSRRSASVDANVAVRWPMSRNTRTPSMTTGHGLDGQIQGVGSTKPVYATSAACRSSASHVASIAEETGVAHASVLMGLAARHLGGSCVASGESPM